MHHFGSLLLRACRFKHFFTGMGFAQLFLLRSFISAFFIPQVCHSFTQSEDAANEP